MIWDALFSAMRAVVNFVLAALPETFLVSAPTTAFFTVCQYGMWVIGADLVVIVIGRVLFWRGVHIVAGLFDYIWHHLPVIGN